MSDVYTAKKIETIQVSTNSQSIISVESVNFLILGEFIYSRTSQTEARGPHVALGVGSLHAARGHLYVVVF